MYVLQKLIFLSFLGTSCVYSNISQLRWCIMSFNYDGMVKTQREKELQKCVHVHVYVMGFHVTKSCTGDEHVHVHVGNSNATREKVPNFITLSVS